VFFRAGAVFAGHRFFASTVMLLVAGLFVLCGVRPLRFPRYELEAEPIPKETAPYPQDE